MSLSRKHYRAVADVLAAEYSVASDPASRRHVVNIAHSLADVFARDNAQFDRARFYAAAWQDIEHARRDSKRIDRLERLTNSVNGNPRYRVHFDDGTSAVTMSDAGFCYGITNLELRGNVHVEYTPAGRIRAITPTS